MKLKCDQCGYMHPIGSRCPSSGDAITDRMRMNRTENKTKKETKMNNQVGIGSGLAGIGAAAQFQPDRQPQLTEQLNIAARRVEECQNLVVMLSNRLVRVLTTPAPCPPEKDCKVQKLDELIPAAHDVRSLALDLDQINRTIQNIMDRLET